MNPKPTERETLVEGWREGATWGGWKDRMRNELMSTGRAGVWGPISPTAPCASLRPSSLTLSTSPRWPLRPLPVLGSTRVRFQSCPTLGDSMDCSPSGSSVHRIFQARILEWVAISLESAIYY